MRTPLTRALVAVLAPVVVLGDIALVPAQAAVPAASDPTSTARTAARNLLAQVADAFAAKPTARSSKPTADPSGRSDLTLLLRDLGAALPSLTPSERATAKRYLARPTDNGGDYVGGGITIGLDGTVKTYDTTHFLIHYQSQPAFLGRDQRTSLTQVKTTASVLESVYATEVTKLGYRKPRSDSATASPSDPNNPNSKIDVYLADLGANNQGLYGYVYTDDDRGSTAAPYLVLDNDFKPSQFGGAPAINSLKVTVAHEFFHAIQFAYDFNDSTWFMEGTAVWMEDTVYPKINDYLQYLPDSQIVRPGLPLNTNSGPEWYSTVIFWKFLSEHFHDTGILRQIWGKAAVSSGNLNGRQAVVATMKARKTSFSVQFGNYAAWNTLPVGSYADRKYFPTFRRWFTKTLGRSARTTGAKATHIDHLASTNFFLHPGTSLRSRSRVKITVNGPNRTHAPVARVQVRYQGKVTTYKVALNSSGNGSKYVTFNPKKVRSVVVTLSNASAGSNNQPYRVRATVVY